MPGGSNGLDWVLTPCASVSHPLPLTTEPTWAPAPCQALALAMSKLPPLVQLIPGQASPCRGGGGWSVMVLGARGEEEGTIYVVWGQGTQMTSQGRGHLGLVPICWGIAAVLSPSIALGRVTSHYS